MLSLTIYVYQCWRKEFESGQAENVILADVSVWYIACLLQQGLGDALRILGKCLYMP